MLSVTMILEMFEGKTIFNGRVQLYKFISTKKILFRAIHKNPPVCVKLVVARRYIKFRFLSTVSPRKY